MSHPDFIYGYIVESPWRRVPPGTGGELTVCEREIGQAFNDAAIAALPEVDATWPPLIRSMVSIPDRNQVFASYGYRRAIGFALHSNHLYTGFAEWLDKFETLLLRRMLWYEAEVRYVGEHLCGDHRVAYRSGASRWWDGDNPSLADSWKFILQGPDGREPYWGIFPDLRRRPGYREPNEFGGVPFD